MLPGTTDDVTSMLTRVITLYVNGRGDVEYKPEMKRYVCHRHAAFYYKLLMLISMISSCILVNIIVCTIAHGLGAVIAS
jgi:hypothetical protein